MAAATVRKRCRLDGEHDDVLRTKLFGRSDASIGKLSRTSAPPRSSSSTSPCARTLASVAWRATAVTCTPPRASRAPISPPTAPSPKMHTVTAQAFCREVRSPLSVMPDGKDYQDGDHEHDTADDHVALTFLAGQARDPVA